MTKQKQMQISKSSSYILFALYLGSCQYSPTPYSPPTLPSHFPPLPVNSANPTTVEGIVLGKKLFFDTKLSGNNQLACASCHQPQRAFTDGLALTAAGHSGKTLFRHTPSLFYVAWATNLFWDGGATNLESLSVAPLTNVDEMNQNLKELPQELADDPAYLPLFQTAFPQQPVINSQNILRALAQFQRTLFATETAYDLYLQDSTRNSLPTLALQGLEIVQTKCTPCHASVLFTDHSFHNNGLNTDSINQLTIYEGIYQGRGRVTNQLQDYGKFRTPTLRNVLKTPPYMHDGRFQSIEEVLQHYQEGVKLSKTLSPFLKKRNGQLGIALTIHEKKAIIEFLKTLNSLTP